MPMQEEKVRRENMNEYEKAWELELSLQDVLEFWVVCPVAVVQ